MSESAPLASPTGMNLKVELVSDVVCPWCVIGYLQFLSALSSRQEQINLSLHWRAFELNPDMPEAGQNQREHVAQKYGSTPEQSQAARARLAAAGEALGFSFNYQDDMRMVNTFRAHKLLHWAQSQNKQTQLSEALFAAFFSNGEDINNVETLLAVCEGIGLDPEAAKQALEDKETAYAVRNGQRHWREEGIQAVPTFIINDQYMVQGAQDAEAFGRMLDTLLARHASANSRLHNG